MQEHTSELKSAGHFEVLPQFTETIAAMKSRFKIQSKLSRHKKMRMQAKEQDQNKEKETPKENREDDNTKIILTDNQVFIPDDCGQTETFLDLNHLNLNNDEEKKDDDGNTIP